MSQEIVVETVATTLVAGREFSTTLATLPEDMTAAINILVQHVAEAHLTETRPVITVYTEEMHADRPWMCGVRAPVAETFGEHPTLRSHEVPGGVIATLTHVGSYGGLKATYNTLFGWFAEHGHSYVGAPREIYLNGPNGVAEDELLTRLEIPVVLAAH